MSEPAPAIALIAKTIIPMIGEAPARGRDLMRPVAKIDNGVILIQAGRIREIGPKSRVSLPPGATIRDLGPCVMTPPLANAHCHLQLSWLAGKTNWGHGFAAWLKSLIPLISGQAAHFADPESAVCQSLDAACRDMAAAGTAHVGDYGGSAPGALTAVAESSKKHGLQTRHFCEWLGFTPPLIDGNGPWPPRCRAEAAHVPGASPAGHALYSTAPHILQMAHAWCREHGHVFALHLAESDGETEMLQYGSGPLHDLYAAGFLPEDWRAPGMRPTAYAASLGLTGPGILAVHGVKLNREEIELLGETALCLCPRSNANLNVGAAPLADLLKSRLLLCLGTDGLTSNTSLDVREEAAILRQRHDVAPEALLRMLTVNGAAALGLDPALATLTPGAPARYAVWPRGLV